ncbi:hypothetical protein SGFS_050170 [Streptomyces graminofaciens]|uniref:Insertion element IS402-like domain-containing protein n=1 Tax=Streptomyces graminofaciens TaxID=68212 RepID=A0ABM7FBN9_9ACTN|nr:hypothetical protein SGFS_050170 [Streptomyces graminofaciens]
MSDVWGCGGRLASKAGRGLSQGAGTCAIRHDDLAGTGAPWRDIPERHGPWDRVHDLFRRWQRDGT